ncbi:hypothetical protein Mal4_51770 [Maioricimonas rarisocia]|uniref:Uncharacterized protein n=1 Tax=Maioricimonas rarisocia TaxID=2528026 RepID=A0A517ZEC9_9PLAN|nr:hypothetical protein [Maioricimonas rarisocia]QDU40815.1 hypothetical protein Mal4_51770 [Maioricimonas rarisocia]
MLFRLRGRAALLAAVLACPTMTAPVMAADCAPAYGNKCYTQPHATQPYCPPGTPSAPPVEPPMAPGDKPMDDPMRDPMTDQPQAQQQQPQAQQPQQQQPQLAQPTFTPSAPTTAASSPQSVSPNMIGDFFGTGGGTISIPQMSRDFTGPILSGGSPAMFTALTPSGSYVGSPASPVFVTQTVPGPISVIGDAVGTIPTGSFWTAAGPVPSGFGPFATFTSDFLLNENPDETAATAAAFPNSAAVVFNGAQAFFVSNTGTVTPIISGVPFEGNGNFAVGTSYTIIDSFAQTLYVPAPASTNGGNVGRQKIGENTNPIPRDRVFMNYSLFDGARLAQGGVNVHRFTPGIEKTFFDGLASLEVRVPFAATANSNFVAGGPIDDNNVEFGSLTFYLKTLLHQTSNVAVGAGLGIAVPTYDDSTVSIFNPATNSLQRLVDIEAESVHLMPYIGAVLTPTERFFAQAFLQFDVDTNGNTVRTLNPMTGRLANTGTIQDSTYLFMDLAVGYWVHLNPESDSFVRGLAPVAELHWNRTLDSQDFVAGNGYVVGNPQQGRIETWNAVVGVNALLHDDATVTVGYGVPIAGGDDQFNGELRIIFNWLFGGAGSDPQRRVF